MVTPDKELIDYSLLQYLTYYFLESPAIKITLNNTPIQHEEYRSLVSSPEMLVSRYTPMSLESQDTTHYSIEYHYVSLQNYKIRKYLVCQEYIVVSDDDSPLPNV